MSQHNNTPGNSLNENEGKDNKSGLDKKDIQSEIDKLLTRAQGERERENIFPVEVFPRPIQEIISATNESLNFPIDFIGSSMLYAASVAIGNTHKVEVKKGFQESGVLYLSIVARPGTNKTHPLSFALQPIVEQDKRTYKLYEQQRKEFEKSASLSKKERDKQSIGDPVIPVWQKYLLSDFTPEALAEVHKFNKRGIGVYVDELAGWFKNFNRYTKGSEMEFWLSAWNSKPINIDRKSGEPVFIPTPFISVAGTIQNGVLSELAKDRRTQNGFIDRMLFVIPDNLQKPYWNEKEILPSIIENWGRIIQNLLTLSIQLDETLNPIPKLLMFTPEAKQLLFAWQRTNTDQCNEAENEALSGIYSKLDMYAVRLALILEMMHWACKGTDEPVMHVGLEATSGALNLVEYFKKSAVKVNSIISNFNPLDQLPANKRSFYHALPTTFQRKDGLQIAETFGVTRPTYDRFLIDKNLFRTVKTGGYEKLI